MNSAWRRWFVLFLVIAAAGAVVWLVATLANRSRPLPAVTVSPLPADCLQEATACLAQAGLTGEVSLRGDGTLAVNLLLSTRWPAEQAPQAVWSAFDAVAAMPSYCPYQQAEVLVTTAETQLRAVVSAVDLLAWAAGDIGDDELVERVLYLEEPLSSAP